MFDTYNIQKSEKPHTHTHEYDMPSSLDHMWDINGYYLQTQTGTPQWVQRFPII